MKTETEVRDRIETKEKFLSLLEERIKETPHQNMIQNMKEKTIISVPMEVAMPVDTLSI
jgi:hypothetical protein